MAALPGLHACSAITAYTTACMTSPKMHPWATSAYQWPAWVTHTRCSHNAMQQSMTPLLLRAHKHQQAKPIVTLANWLQSSLIQEAIDRYERHPTTYRS